MLTGTLGAPGMPEFRILGIAAEFIKMDVFRRFRVDGDIKVRIFGTDAVHHLMTNGVGFAHQHAAIHDQFDLGKAMHA